MVLSSYLKNRLAEKEILIMTHIVLGYPSFEASKRIIEAMVSAGVDLMELQIPFSEPTADGPVIARANQKALEDGVTVAECLELAHLSFNFVENAVFTCQHDNRNLSKLRILFYYRKYLVTIHFR